jgi:alkanesulfonate monooxygenase SsuD/methylene tetrahydromethanopterin reductase-like flavin-dependent oxidoreductase (luciferase family)
MPQSPRFGIVRNQNLPWQTLVRHWQEFERLGFDSIWHADHFQRPSLPEAPFLEGWTLLAALALQTEKPRIGILVSSNTFRHPPLLAKQAVTVDHISGGRLELGIGTGWYRAEHERFGVPFPETPELVGRFEEAVMLIDALLTKDVTSWEGRYYQVHDAPFRPAPLQQPRPPITLGAHGPRMLRIAARYADRWNSYGTSVEIRERNDRLDEACAASGRDPDPTIRSPPG